MKTIKAGERVGYPTFELMPNIFDIASLIANDGRLPYRGEHFFKDKASELLGVCDNPADGHLQPQ